MSDKKMNNSGIAWELKVTKYAFENMCGEVLPDLKKHMGHIYGDFTPESMFDDYMRINREYLEKRRKQKTRHIDCSKLGIKDLSND